MVIGGGLLFFAWSVWRAARSLSTKEIRIVIFSDFAWVCGSGAILLGGFFPMTTLGYQLIAAVAFVVLVFGVLQWYFLRSRLRARRDL